MLALLAAAAFAVPASAQVLYKWIDANGKVQYSDQPPKNFKGPVTRIEPDAAATGNTVTLPKATPKAAADGVQPPAPPDMARERRTRRETLQARLDEARAKVEAARKALDEGRDPQQGEQQYIQQRVTDPGGRVNCRKVRDPAGKESLICAASVLKEEYFDRVSQLEATLKGAEEELAAAENAYRRGVD